MKSTESKHEMSSLSCILGKEACLISFVNHGKSSGTQGDHMGKGRKTSN